MSAALKRTPLFQAHQRAGARMIDFGGWEMPLAYGSQIEEHHAVRRDAGMFDVSHMLSIDVSGAEASRYLRRLLANDVDRLSQSGEALYSCMLNPEGGVIDDLIVYKLGDFQWRVVVNAATADADIAWMLQVAHSENFDVALDPRRDLAMVAVQGPNARGAVWASRPAWQGATQALRPFTAAFVDSATLVARTGYTGEDGFEIILPVGQAEALWEDLAGRGVRRCGLGARDTLRLEAGLNLYGSDMDESVTPDESGLSWTVSLSDPDREFVGRDAIEALSAARHLVGVMLCDRGVMRAHMTLRTALGDGEITSGTMSPTLGVSIGLARVPSGVQAGDEVQVELRGRWLQARIVKPPFVRRGKILVQPA